MFSRNLNLRNHRFRNWGFTLVELAIVLGVVGIMAAGLWRLMATGSQQTKDQATAQQHLALLNSVSGFLADTGGQGLMTAMSANGIYNLKLPLANTDLATCQASIISVPTGNVLVLGGTDVTPFLKAFCNYIPTGMNAATTNPYSQTYQIGILKDGAAATTVPSSYSFMIATAGTAIPDTNGGRISGLIGGDGGFVYNSTAVCGAAKPTACGTMGAWQVPNVGTTYGIATANNGLIASRTFISPTTNNSMLWLARGLMMGDAAAYTYNTMTTDIFMGTKLAATTNSAAAGGAPSIHLQNGYMDGTLSSTSTMNVINLTAPTPTTQILSPSLMQLNGGCSSTTAGYQSTAGGPGIACASALFVTGDITLTGQVSANKIYSSSDARLKTDIYPIRNALGDLMKIDPVSFTFKAGGSKSMGVTAQNLEKIYPELVTQGATGYKSVEYNGLIGPLIGAVQELKRQNDDLRQQLHADEVRLNHLEKTSHH